VTITSLHRAEQPASLRAQVEKTLSAAIISGELAPGTLVSVPTLAVQFRVSATPVREAMLDLEKRGFVESVRNKGFRVTAVSDEHLRQIVEVRQLLEPPAMEELARRGFADESREHAARADAIVAGAQTGDLKAYLEADQVFHRELTALLGNPLLTEMVSDLRSRTRLVGLAAMLESDRLSESAAEHHELLGYLVAGDAESAGALMHRHIHHALGWWSGRAETVEDDLAVL
jgi:DNA-binding GntR family transcriptional regulator